MIKYMKNILYYIKQKLLRHNQLPFEIEVRPLLKAERQSRS